MAPQQQRHQREIKNGGTSGAPKKGVHTVTGLGLRLQVVLLPGTRRHLGKSEALKAQT